MNPSNFIPMSETAYYILLSLLTEMHGYKIMQHVSKITNNRINLGAGTLYGTLSKLEKNNLISMIKEENKRKYYKITDLGTNVLLQEISRIKELYTNGNEELKINNLEVI